MCSTKFSRVITTTKIYTATNSIRIAAYTVAKSKSTSWGAARWLTGVTDHITGDDWHDWHADQ